MHKDATPADVATLAWAAPGQEVEVRAVLGDAARCLPELRPGDVLRCREITAHGPVFGSARIPELRLTWPEATQVQVERVGFASPIPFWRRDVVRPQVSERRARRNSPALRLKRAVRSTG